MTATKARVKAAVGGLARSGLGIRGTRRALARRRNVVYYHYVGEEAPYYAHFYEGSTAERFDAELAELGRHFDFAPLADVAQGAAGTGGRPRLAVTFDDGFDMHRNGVMEILARHGVSATTFVMTSCIGNELLMWRHKLSAILALCDEPVAVARYNALADAHGYSRVADAAGIMRASKAEWAMRQKDELAEQMWRACSLPPVEEFLDEQRPYFTWSGLDEWVAAGHSVGLHTATHPVCSRLDDEEIVEEIVEPARLLKERLGIAALPMSYPFGARLDASKERSLYSNGVFAYAFGIRGFTHAAAPAYRMERACAEGPSDFALFGKAFLGLPRPSA